MTELREQVRERYARAAITVLTGAGAAEDVGGNGCCAPEGGLGVQLYDALQRDALPDEAVLASLGCGNPTAVADLRQGETVLDLGSGGGIDVLLSAKRVGPTGKAYGLDMTEEMLSLARANAERAGATNVEFLRKVAASRAFGSAELDTGLIERNRAELISSIDLDPFLATAAFAELAHEEAEAQRLAAASGDFWSPWHRVDGWQLNAEAHHDFVFVEGGAEHRVRVRFGGDAPVVSIAGREYHGKSARTHTVRDGNDWHVLCDGIYRRLSLKPELSDPDEEATGSLTAPMPGRIVKVMAMAGAKVGKGEPLLILEAMKMEHTITAPADGTVKTIHYGAGEQVLEGAELVTLE